MTVPAFPDRAGIESRQLAALRGMMQEIVPRNRFYTRKLGVSAPPLFASLAEFRERVPFTVK